MTGSISQDEADIRGEVVMGFHCSKTPVEAPVEPAKAAPLPEVKPTLTVVLGRLQPPHRGHLDLINHALETGTRTLLLLGSATESRSLDNPFTYTERKALVESIYSSEIASGKLTILPLRDMKYRDAHWHQYACETISKFADSVMDRGEIVLVGMEKDPETTGCLALFKDDMTIKIVEQKRVLNATDIRAELFAEHGDLEIHRLDMPEATYKFLCAFKGSKEFKSLQAEYTAVVKQQKINDEVKRVAGFAPIYVAVDALTIWRDYWEKPHLLVITRKGEIGKGKYALVGGYLNHDETILTAVKRENNEEASFDLDSFVLRGVEVFDHPKRSKRGRMITHVHHFEKRSDFPPAIEAGDDAETVQWIPLDQIANLQHLFFADHYHIIAKMLPVVERFYRG